MVNVQKPGVTGNQTGNKLNPVVALISLCECKTPCKTCLCVVKTNLAAAKDEKSLIKTRIRAVKSLMEAVRKSDGKDKDAILMGLFDMRFQMIAKPVEKPSGLREKRGVEKIEQEIDGVFINAQLAGLSGEVAMSVLARNLGDEAAVKTAIRTKSEPADFVYLSRTLGEKGAIGFLANFFGEKDAYGAWSGARVEKPTKPMEFPMKTVQFMHKVFGQDMNLYNFFERTANPAFAFTCLEKLKLEEIKATGLKPGDLRHESLKQGIHNELMQLTKDETGARRRLQTRLKGPTATKESSMPVDVLEQKLTAYFA